MSTEHRYLLMIFLCGAISAYDNALNVIFWDALPHTEKNPVALAIIESYGIWGLVATKSAGTILAVAIMISLLRTKWKVAIVPVFVFQVWLFFYLSFSSDIESNWWRNDFFIVWSELFKWLF